MYSVVKKSEIYHFEIGDINQEFKIAIEINKLEKEVLLQFYPTQTTQKYKNITII